MSDVEECPDIFQEPVDPSRLNVPTHYNEPFERANGKGTLDVQMVKRHVLWGDHLWNASQWLGWHFDRQPEEVQGKSVIELGAGAGVPSIIAALNGAKFTIVTDYPDRELIDNLHANLETNIPADLRDKIVEKGFLWGAPVDEFLELNSGAKFDVVILCDLLFNHSEHIKLLKSCQDLLAPNGEVWCVFTHYVVDRVKKDLVFLDKAPEFGFEVEWVGQHKFDHLMFKNDRGDPEVRRTCHITKMRWAK